MALCWQSSSYLFFFNDPATTEIYTLSLHDALPIWVVSCEQHLCLLSSLAPRPSPLAGPGNRRASLLDRKSTRLNSSHTVISYAVFCLKKKKKSKTLTKPNSSDIVN